MDFDFELEEILSSFKESKKDKAPDSEENAAKSVTPEVGKAEAPPPPKPVYYGAETAPAEPESKKKEKVRVSFRLPEPIERALKALSERIKKIPLKKAGLALGALLAAIALIFGAVKLVDYGKTAYIHKYEKKYNITFPAGIKKDFCDEYGKDQSFAGKIYIGDTSTEKSVYANPSQDNAVLKKGSSVLEAQEVRSIALDKSYADLESIYSTPEGFKNASQKVVFETLFDEECYRVVSAFYTNTKAEDDDGYIFPYCAYGNLTEKSFRAFEDRIKSRRLYDTGFKLLYEHRILTLSVQSDFMPDFRFVVVCVKTKDNFKKSKTAIPNETIHYPQIWYDKKGEKNPFFLAGKWYPEIITDGGKGDTQQLTAEDFDLS